MSDGRDLLMNIIPKDEADWRPSMNLYELIQRIPDFIAEKLKPVEGKEPPQMTGRFHLGL
jgi:hypothetical protein